MVYDLPLNNELTDKKDKVEEQDTRLTEMKYKHRQNKFTLILV
ncbi:hypothetical protein [Enterococcus lactis]|nr:hypothetical protein [Enterococcus lactis]